MADHHEYSPQTIVDAIDEMAADLDGPTIPSTVLAVLDRLIPTQEVAFAEMDYRLRRFVSHQWRADSVELFVGDIDAKDEQWWSLASAAKTPANPRLSRTGLIARWTAAFSTSEISSWPLYQEYWRGTGDLISVEFPAPPGRTRRLLLWREAPDCFSAAEESVVRLLRPHLFEIDRLARRRQDGSPKLTAREWQVLELVGQGASNAEVAAALMTSVATVRKHMEHIFDRSGVRTRSAAVARLLPAHAVGDPLLMRG